MTKPQNKRPTSQQKLADRVADFIDRVNDPNAIQPTREEVDRITDDLIQYMKGKCRSAGDDLDALAALYDAKVRAYAKDSQPRIDKLPNIDGVTFGLSCRDESGKDHQLQVTVPPPPLREWQAKALTDYLLLWEFQYVVERDAAPKHGRPFGYTVELQAAHAAYGCSQHGPSFGALLARNAAEAALRFLNDMEAVLLDEQDCYRHSSVAQAMGAISALGGPAKAASNAYALLRAYVGDGLDGRQAYFETCSALIRQLESAVVDMLIKAGRISVPNRPTS
jgi:hypothetical protein